MIKKAAKMGFKQYKINDAKTTYCLRSETYSNSKGDEWKDFQLQDYDLRSFTQPALAVLFLIEPYLYRGYTIGIDKWYTKP